MTFQKSQIRRGAVMALLFAGVVSFGGCKNDSVDGRVPVSGAVTLDGAPIVRGTVEFHPQDPGGLQSGGMITDGKFEITGEFGPRPGKYQVRVFAANENEMVVEPEAPGDSRKVPLAKERVPSKFNTKSELFETIPEGGKKNLNFDITSK